MDPLYPDDYTSEYMLGKKQIDTKQKTPAKDTTSKTTPNSEKNIVKTERIKTCE